MGSYIVRANRNGKGRTYLFGLTPDESKLMGGLPCMIGDKNYKLDRRGRLTIPKWVMDLGIISDDGRMVIAITFSSSYIGERAFTSTIMKPNTIDRNRKTGWRITEFEDIERVLKPADGPDSVWSPD